MFGFDGCCCSCTEWFEPHIDGEVLADNWIVESGDWTLTTTASYPEGHETPYADYRCGYLSCAGNGSIRCKYSCSEETGRVYFGIREGIVSLGDYSLSVEVYDRQHGYDLYKERFEGPSGLIEERYAEFVDTTVANYSLRTTLLCATAGFAYNTFYLEDGTPNSNVVRLSSTAAHPAFFQGFRLLKRRASSANGGNYTWDQSGDDYGCAGRPICYLPHQFQVDLSGFGVTGGGEDLSFLNGSFPCSRFGGATSYYGEEDSYNSAATYGYDMENSFNSLYGVYALRPTPFLEVYPDGRMLVTTGGSAWLTNPLWPGRINFHINAQGNQNFRSFGPTQFLCGAFNYPNGDDWSTTPGIANAACSVTAIYQ